MKKEDIINVFGGTFLMAVGISCFFDPQKLIIGGASGLSILLSAVCEGWFGIKLPLWALFSAVNIPLFGAGFLVLGFKSLRRSFFATILLSVMIWITGLFPSVESDLTIASVVGGFIEGAGLGLVLKSDFTTGGSDLLGMILHKKIPSISVSHFMLITDYVIIGAGFWEFGTLNAFYALVSVYISVKAIDFIVTGAGYTKAVYIISDQWEEISHSILTKFERGVTTLKGRGEYTKTEKNVILCVVLRKQLAGLKRTVEETDKNAFMIITDAAEVTGEGFSGEN